jgi:hypothetical protein
VQRGFEDAAIGMLVLTRDLYVLQLNGVLYRLWGAPPTRSSVVASSSGIASTPVA